MARHLGVIATLWHQINSYGRIGMVGGQLVDVDPPCAFSSPGTPHSHDPSPRYTCGSLTLRKMSERRIPAREDAAKGCLRHAELRPIIPTAPVKASSNAKLQFVATTCHERGEHRWQSKRQIWSAGGNLEKRQIWSAGGNQSAAKPGAPASGRDNNMCRVPAAAHRLLCFSRCGCHALVFVDISEEPNPFTSSILCSGRALEPPNKFGFRSDRRCLAGRHVACPGRSLEPLVSTRLLPLASLDYHPCTHGEL